MRIYINYNFCGYKWFTINNLYESLQTDNIVLDLLKHNTVESDTIKKLRIYDSYNLAYLNAEGHFILALRHILEKERHDEYGRRLEMAYIFISDESDRELMDKIALTYISHKGLLDEALSEIISSSTNNVNYNLPQLNKFLESIQRARIQNSEFRFGKGKIRLLVSNWRNETISENLNLNIKEFIKVKHTTEEFSNKILISNPYTDDQEQEHDDDYNSDLRPCNIFQRTKSVLKNCFTKDIIRPFVIGLGIGLGIGYYLL